MPVIENIPALSLDKILYGADLSPIANGAGKYAKGLAQRFGSKVHIVHVYPGSDESAGEAIRLERLARRRNLVQQENDFRASGIDAHTLGSIECPVSSALELMEKQLGPDLIVIGTHSKSSLDRLLIGSTAEHLIRNARCPVLTVGPNAKHPCGGPLVFERIVFAADFTPSSNMARSVALGFAQDANAHLWICHVVNTRQENSLLPHPVGCDFRNELENLFPPEAYDWCSPTFTIEYGNPAEAILDLAERVNADLIVMGARTRSFWLTHLHRGVTQDVLAGANCPVLTVR